jgi:hypothetical protein
MEVNLHIYYVFSKKNGNGQLIDSTYFSLPLLQSYGRQVSPRGDPDKNPAAHTHSLHWL